MGLLGLFGLGVTLLTLGCDGCDGPDKVVFENESGNEIGFWVDGADSTGTFNGKTFTTSDTVFEFSFEVLERPDDSEEVAAFTRGRPPFVRNPMTFHDGQDLVLIDFQDEIELDFSVWIVDVDWVNTVSNRENETIDALAYAEGIWDTERMGLKVGSITVHDATGDPDADDDDVRDHEEDDDDYFENIASEIGFDADRINIYLVRKAFGSRYYGVAEVGGDQLAMGMYTGGEDLLIHEIGHNFSMEHVDGDANFDSKNVGTSVGSVWTKRQFFTEGQTFRCHMEPGSAINDTYDARTGLYTIDCDHSSSATVGCPRIHKRIWADGSFPAN
jgi:hypothetical protein